jgi:hypothetical protein
LATRSVAAVCLEAPRYSRLEYVIREVPMPTQPRVPSPDEPSVGKNHDDLALSADEADRDILDEDSLREDQPYAVLEEAPERYGPHDSQKRGGAGSG